MPAFTKGNWLIFKNTQLIYSDINDRPIAFVAGGVDEEEKANARLIALAPVMYEALKECYCFIEAIICHDCEYCSRSLDADGLRIALDDLFACIDGMEEKS